MSLSRFLWVGLPVLWFVAGCGPGGGNQAGPVIVVEAIYPGANAATVADTLAAPIEQQVNGAEHLRSLESECTADGTYRLRLVFEPGTDLDAAQREIQNRTELALPMLPDVVRARGATVRKKTPEPFLLVSLSSYDGAYDTFYLSNYARIQVQDELARVPGVADICLFGAHATGLQLAVDTERLTAYRLTLPEVVTALRGQNIQVERVPATGPASSGPASSGLTSPGVRLQCTNLGRPLDGDSLGEVILVANSDGERIRVRDVAQVEVAAQADSFAALNARPAVLLGIHALPTANPQQVSQAVRERLDTLRGNTPQGLRLEVAVDLSQPQVEHLLIDLVPPPGASPEQQVALLELTERTVQQLVNGEATSVMTTQHPSTLLRDQPAVLVALNPAKNKKLVDVLRPRLQNELPGCLFSICSVEKSRGASAVFPIEFALEDVGQQGGPALLDAAEALAKKLTTSGKFVDVIVSNSFRPAPALHYEIDRDRCRSAEVSVAELTALLELQPAATKFERQGIKNKNGDVVLVEQLVRVQQTAEPTLIERHNLYPAIRLRANLATGVQLRPARQQCEELAKENLGQPFRFEWIR